MSSNLFQRFFLISYAFIRRNLHFLFKSLLSLYLFRPICETFSYLIPFLDMYFCVRYTLKRLLKLTRIVDSISTRSSLLSAIILISSANLIISSVLWGSCIRSLCIRTSIIFFNFFRSSNSLVSVSKNVQYYLICHMIHV